jgi:hypothetical protein
MRAVTAARWGLAVAALVVGAACGARIVTSADEPNGDGASVDAAPPPEAGCTLVGTKCVGYPLCCGPAVGTPVDVDAGCLGEPIYTCGPPEPVADAICVYPTIAAGCRNRVSEGGTEYVWGQVRGFDQSCGDAAAMVEEIFRSGRRCP